MALKHLYLLLLAALAVGNAQNVDESQIPVENDNQFPPDNQSDIIEGSGVGVIDEPTYPSTETTEAPPLEHFANNMILEDKGNTADETDGCPSPCVCHIEGSTNDFVIDCSGFDLTEIPAPLNEKATKLYIQNNKITEIPKRISALIKLQYLDASDNSIMSLASGSVSELPELVTLKLANNRLIEYPNDLKNGFGLGKLKTLDLGGNDMRTVLNADIFEKFSSLNTITLPSPTEELQQDLCKVLSATLIKVCPDSCDHEVYECQEETGDDDDDLGHQIPGQLVPSEDYDNTDSDPSIEAPKENGNQDDQDTENESSHLTTSSLENVPNDFPLRSAVNNQPNGISPFNTMVDVPNEASSTTELATKVSATKSETKTGGVDKSIIGLVVAGMIVVVAGITIKKNWNSIRKRFSSNSNSRTPNDRVDSNVNGTRPEEVPLQDKSPV